MSTLKLIGLGAAWILASVAFAVVAAIVVTELLDLIGLVESGQTSYSVALNATALVLFLGISGVPILFRSRFMDTDS